MCQRWVSVLFVVMAFSLILPGQAGSWKQIGKAKAWAGTIAGVPLNGKLYTVDQSGALYATEPASGAWKQLGKPDFTATALLMAAAGRLFTIENDGSLYAIDPASGAWQRLGAAGSWAGTIAGVGLNGKLYTVEKSGALYVTDPASGAFKLLGKPDFAATAFLLAAAGKLYSIEKDGSLYAIEPANGSWKRVGAAAGWANTIAACGTPGAILTVERGGKLYATDPASGVWKQLGKTDFAATRFMLPCSGNLFTIEREGSLFQVDIGGAAPSLAPAPVANTASAAAVAGNLTFAFMGTWLNESGMTMRVTLDGITMSMDGKQIGPIPFQVITSKGNTLLIESSEPGKGPTRQEIVFLEAKRIQMGEQGRTDRTLTFVKK